MRTAIVHQTFTGRYNSKEEAIAKAKELGGYPCHLWYTNKGIECSFGYAVAVNDEIIGCNEYTWI